MIAAQAPQVVLDWTPLVVAAIPATAAIAAAVVAALSARRTHVTESQTARILDLEQRLASHKADIYQPMVELFRGVMDPVTAPRVSEETDIRETLSSFTTWLGIYGSDQAVKAMHRYMQCVFNDAPPIIHLRYYAEFLLAVRRDMGYLETNVTPVDLLGMRIKDIYQGAFGKALLMSEEELHKSEEWHAPWAK